VIIIVATNFTPVTAKDIDSFKFGSVAWSAAEMSATDESLDAVFATNNATPIIDLIGDRDAESPVKSDAWVKEITFGGNERSITEENLLGSTTTGAQNKVVLGSTVSSMTCTMKLLYRNNVPALLFSDTTKCGLMTVNTGESAATGAMNFVFNNITVTSIGELTQNADGTMEQTVKFSLAAGTNDGTAISVTSTTPAGTWSKVVMGDYAEEVRLTLV